MKTRLLFTALIFAVMTTTGHAQLGDLLKKVKEKTSKKQRMTDL
jgi:hypothetical protein